MAILFILLSIAAVGIWPFWAAARELDQLHEILMNFSFMAVGSAGTFFMGQLVADRRLKQQVRERYRHLRTVHLHMGAIISTIESVESGPRLGYQGEDGKLVEEYRIAMSNITALAASSAEYIRDCLESWFDFAPDKVEDLRRQFYGEDTHDD